MTPSAFGKPVVGVMPVAGERSRSASCLRDFVVNSFSVFRKRKLSVPPQTHLPLQKIH
jgi:hypothetical protein